MESRIQRIFLGTIGFVSGNIAKRSCVTAMSLIMLGLVPAADAKEQPDIEPLPIRDVERREIKVDQIDDESFEIGVFAGVLDVEDFGSDSVTGLRFAYHITEDFFIEGTYGMSELGQTSFEELSGGAKLLTDSERDLTYYDAAIGWNALPGESFLGGKYAVKSSLYLLLGAGSTEFGGDDVFTINAGIGYRMVALDWLALHVTARDHMWESDLLGKSENKHNIEVTGSLTVFF